MEPLLLLQHLLEPSLQQQYATQELARGLQATTQDLLQQRSTTRPIPSRLPDLWQEALRLLPKLSPSDDIEAYLYVFEQMAQWEIRPKEE